MATLVKLGQLFASDPTVPGDIKPISLRLFLKHGTQRAIADHVDFETRRAFVSNGGPLLQQIRKILLLVKAPHKQKAKGAAGRPQLRVRAKRNRIGSIRDNPDGIRVRLF